MDLELLFQLIQRQGTLEQVSNFLHLRGLPSSAGSWKDMIDRRLRPATNKGELSHDDLIDLLRQTEEHGSQHIFVFTQITGRQIKYLFDGSLSARLAAIGFPAVGATSIVDIPETPTVVEVREDTNPVKSVLFKMVEKRASLEKVSGTSTNGQFIVTYNEVPYRAVNIMRIREDGRADIRIQSHADAVSYNGAAEAVFNLLHPVVDRLDWKDQKLDKFKANLFDVNKRATLQTVLGLKHAQHSNVEGTRLSAAVGSPGASMYDDPEVVASLDRFLEKEDHAHCERASVQMKRNDVLQRSVGLVLSGEPNEFAITSKVSKAEYEEILKTVLKNNT